MSSTLQLAWGLAPLLWAAFHQGALAGTPVSCPRAPLSCQSPVTESSCCFAHPGGQLLLTQFWDTDPPLGPRNSWTIHGLWPDKCDGTYESYCDKSREVQNMRDILLDANPRLLDYVEEYWKSDRGDDEGFWEHEWNKHGTCINTMEPRCYTDYTRQEEVVDYIQKTVDLFRNLDTYKALRAAGITPSRTRTYTSAQLQAALSTVTGREVTIGCKSGSLKEVWYHFNVRGSVLTGEFVPADPDGTKSTCPARGIRYLPKD